MLEGGGSRKQEWLKIDKNRRRTDTQPKTGTCTGSGKQKEERRGLGKNVVGEAGGRVWAYSLCLERIEDLILAQERRKLATKHILLVMSKHRGFEAPSPV